MKDDVGERAGGNETDRAWQAVVAVVMDGRDDWKRKVSEATGLPFSRIRALRRLGPKPLTLRELADALGCDAPAATVIVNDLEGRALVQRRSHPADRRAKIVSLTMKGKRMVDTARSVVEHAPEWVASLPAGDIAVLKRLFAARARPR